LVALVTRQPATWHERKAEKNDENKT